MAKTIKARLRVKHDTTANWNAAIGFVPKAGEVIVYTDYKSYEKDGQTVYEPGIKIGTGNAYVQDLRFCNQTETEEILSHIHNLNIHVTPEEKAFWSNKLNVEDYVEDETIVFNRN